MAITFSVRFDDPEDDYTEYYSDLKSNTIAAAQRWTNHFVDRNASIEIEIAFVDGEGIGTANGGGRVESVGNNVLEPAAAYIVRTGIDNSGNGVDIVDIDINIDPDYLEDELWFDPNPAASTGVVPPFEVDALSVLMHEIGHAFGFIGYRDWNTGEPPPDNWHTPYDELVDMDGGLPYFIGDAASDVYGGPVPLTDGNLFHYGNPEGDPGDDLLFSLMNGVVGHRGYRDEVSPLDVAFMQDLGIPINPYVGYVGNDTITGNGQGNVLLGLEGNDTLNGGAGNDVLDGGFGNDTLKGGNGTDTASYASASSRVKVDLSKGTVAQDTLGAGTDTLWTIENLTGGAYNDQLAGNGSRNTLNGGGGRDTLKGGDGNDVLKGLAGGDVLYGGGGADRFDFDAATDSRGSGSGRDKIEDFSRSGGDRIDLSTIDANGSGAGNGAFTFIGTAAFSGNARGQLRFDKPTHTLFGSTDGDATAEISILLTGINTMTGTNFVL